MQKVEKRLQAILKRAKQNGVTDKQIHDFVLSNITTNMITNVKFTKYLSFLNEKLTKPSKLSTIAIIIVILGLLTLNYLDFSGKSQCLVKMPFDETKVFRRPENCAICRGITEVSRLSNITYEEFEYYASISKPLIITDGTRDWSAPQLFSFNYFKALYQKYKQEKSVCQFFPYKTEFDTLNEALNMSEARSRLEPGTKNWYIGWSNCNDKAGQELRKHYQRPYFIPKTSENMALSWIFMGGPGEGAHMHVDNVHYASWQAQLRGRKKWRLAPPPECYYACEEFAAIVEPGEIIVVDTNRWYHQTHILPGDISITIGTEFD